MIHYSLERIFGIIVRGRPSHLSTFLHISGGNLDTVMVSPSNLNVTHRRDNRIQFISNSNRSSINVICILSEVKGDILIDYDDHLKDDSFSNKFEETLDISVTPSLSSEFYQRVFGLKELLKILDTDNVKETLIENSALVLQYIFSKQKINMNILNNSEKMLVRLYFKLYNDLVDKFERCKSIDFSQIKPHTRPYMLGQPFLRPTTSCAVALSKQATFGNFKF